MSKTRRRHLYDAYGFAGFVPAAEVKGVFGVGDGGPFLKVVGGPFPHLLPAGGSTGR